MTRFAGADLAAAQALAAEAGEGAVTVDGARLEVRVVAGAEPVVFIAGQGLKGAVWKGPARRLRLMVAAAALMVRGAAGDGAAGGGGAGGGVGPRNIWIGRRRRWRWRCAGC